ncbi:hypothetical protein BDF19DRAFT_456338, partial [Syncephalis fuscata]
TLFTFSLLAVVVQSTDALFKFNTDNTTSYSCPTYDPFSVHIDPFYITGVLVAPTYKQDKPCTLNQTKPPFWKDLLKGHLANHTSLIVLITESSAQSGGCQTVSQACEAAVDYSKWLLNSDRPSNSVVVYGLTENVEGTSGGPHTTDYTSHSPNIPDNKYTLPTALLPQDCFKTIQPVLSQLTAPLMVEVQQEGGPWNDIIFSVGYQTFIWTLFVINVFFIFRSIGSIIHLMATRRFRSEIRTCIFVIGILSAICISTFLPMNTTTIVSHSFYEVGSILFTIAFYLVLLIWCTIQEAVQLTSRINYLRMVICLCLFLQTFAYFVKFINHFVKPSDLFQKLRIVCRYTIVSLEITGSVIFLYFSIMFYIKKRSYNSNPASEKALFRLSRISLACFVGFLSSCASNTFMLDDSWNGHMSIAIIRIIFKVIGPTMRSIALLYMLDIRMPSESEADKFSFRALGIQTWSIIQKNFEKKCQGSKKDMLRL